MSPAGLTFDVPSEVAAEDRSYARAPRTAPGGWAWQRGQYEANRRAIDENLYMARAAHRSAADSDATAAAFELQGEPGWAAEERSDACRAARNAGHYLGRAYALALGDG